METRAFTFAFGRCPFGRSSVFLRLIVGSSNGDTNEAGRPVAHTLPSMLEPGAHSFFAAPCRVCSRYATFFTSLSQQARHSPHFPSFSGAGQTPSPGSCTLVTVDVVGHHDGGPPSTWCAER